MRWHSPATEPRQPCSALAAEEEGVCRAGTSPGTVRLPGALTRSVKAASEPHARQVVPGARKWGGGGVAVIATAEVGDEGTD